MVVRETGKIKSTATKTVTLIDSDKKKGEITNYITKFTYST